MVDKGTLFTVQGQENDWTQVALTNGTGWIRSDLLLVAAQVRLTASSVRVRKGPGTNYDILGQVGRGETYPLLGAQNGWYQIDKGWISGDYATVVAGGSPAAAVPAVAAVAPPPTEPAPTESRPAESSSTATPPAETPAAAVPTEAPPIFAGGGETQGVLSLSSSPAAVVQDVMAVPLGRGVSFSVIDAGGRPDLVVKGVDPSQVQTQVSSSNMGKSLTITISGSYVYKYESAVERLGLTRVSLSGTGGSLTVLIESTFSIALKQNYDAATQSLKLGLTEQIVQTQSAAAPASSNQGARRTVVIDPGHGGFTANGFDPGALGYLTRLPERVVVLDISTQLKAILESNGYNVIMTHTGSTTLSLTGRADVANNAGADIFVSVHANASVRHDYGGHSTYFYAPASNSALYAQRRLRNMLAADIQGEMVKAGGRIDLGVMESNFAVLRDTRVPSVLIETAFLSHPEEEQLLGSADYRRKLAEGIARGIHTYFQHVN
jgi:N-acetylmuramoyl-L-alanine amidase